MRMPLDRTGKSRIILNLPTGPLNAGKHLPAALTHLWQISSSRLKAMTEAERWQLVKHGQVTFTARRGLRRMLEHEWEHSKEIAGRAVNIFPT